MVMDLACEVRVVATAGFEDDLCVREEGVAGEIDTAEGAGTDDAAEGVVAYMFQVGGGEFPGWSVSTGQ